MQKCLSMLQPWASLLVMGIKTLETRSFMPPARYTGKLFIHASQAIPRKVYDQYVEDELFRAYVNDACRRSMEFHFPDRPTFAEELIGNGTMTRQALNLAFPMGAIIGSVELAQGRGAWEILDEWKKQGRFFTDWQREWTLGDLGSDRFAWPVTDPQQFKTPIPAKGTVTPILWDCSKYLNTCSENLNTATNG